MGESELRGTRVAVLVEDLYEDLELWYPVLRLREEGAEVTIVGSRAAEYRGKHGYPASADKGIDTVEASWFDAVIIPGGYAPDRLRRYPAVLEFVRAMNAQGKVIAFICHGAWVPISAGILPGKRATCYFAIKDDLVNAGAHYVDAEVVRDGNLISSRQPSDLGAFLRETIRTLARSAEEA